MTVDGFLLLLGSVVVFLNDGAHRVGEADVLHALKVEAASDEELAAIYVPKVFSGQSLIRVFHLSRLLHVVCADLLSMK